MKTKPFIYLACVILVINACTTVKYLPRSEAIDVNQYGSYINITLTNKKIIKGELLAADFSNLTVLTDTALSKKAIIIPLNLVKKFTLFYAKPARYGWSIPVFVLSTLIPFPDPDGGGLMPFHGFFTLLTIPVNLIVTSVVTRNSFRYNNTTISYEQLKMFARYPQGIPANVNIASIK